MFSIESSFFLYPSGHKIRGGKVLRLKKAIYGLKQAGRAWHKNINNYLVKLGYRPCITDPCVYVLLLGGHTALVMCLYVDDVVIASTKDEYADKLATQLKNKYEMQDLGELSWCLRMRIEYNRAARTLAMDQEAYTARVLERAQMENCNPAPTPDRIGTRLQAAEEPNDDIKNAYQILVGSLIYAMTCTRPDIAAATSQVCRFMAKPDKTHWQAVKRIIRYLKGTIGYALKYTNSGSLKLVGYADADWGGNLDNRRSTTGYVFTLCGGPVSWASTTQSTVALSTAEAEYMALSQAAQELRWLRSLLSELGYAQQAPTTLYTDNQAARSMVSGSTTTKRTKHIDIRHHFVRDAVAAGDMDVQWLPSKEMPADFLTKPLSSLRDSWT